MNPPSSPPRMRPTRRQLEVLRAYVRAGSVAAAAYELGISETTVRQHLSGLYRRTGCLNAAQAAYLLGVAGRGESPAQAGRTITPAATIPGIARRCAPCRPRHDPQLRSRGSVASPRRYPVMVWVLQAAIPASV